MRIPLALAFLAFAAPSLAAETPWQEVAPGVRLRLIADNVLSPDGTTLLGLEVDMPPGYKTYWRVPGETGRALLLRSDRRVIDRERALGRGEIGEFSDRIERDEWVPQRKKLATG